MSDTVALKIDKKIIERFSSYSIDSDLYLAADAFQVETAGILPGIKAGQRVQVLINGDTELDGIIDAPGKTCEKGKLTMRLAGRDLSGLLVDAHSSGYGDIQDVTLKQLTERLIAPVPFIQASDVFYENNSGSSELHWDSVYIEPGRNIFDVLAEKAKACGLIFYSLPKGKFYFGKAKTNGPEKFSIICRKDGVGNNYFYGDYVDDIGKRYSEVNVISNIQGTDTKTAAQLSTTAQVKDATFPFKKPFYQLDNSGTARPEKLARMTMDLQRRQGMRLVYRVPGHSQGKRNWAINEFCNVQDEVLDIKGTFLIYGRRFALNKEEGAYTELRLGLPGLL